MRKITKVKLTIEQNIRRWQWWRDFRNVLWIAAIYIAGALAFMVFVFYVTSRFNRP